MMIEAAISRPPTIREPRYIGSIGALAQILLTPDAETSRIAAYSHGKADDQDGDMI
jgi:hypothetical protein